MTKSQRFLAKNIHVDLYNCLTFFDHDKHDFQVFAQYVDEKTYEIVVRRLDQELGWNLPLQVLICDFHHPAIVHFVGASNDPEVCIQLTSEYAIAPSKQMVKRLPRYKMIYPSEPKAISRDEFNQIFETDVVILPQMVYAVGLHDGAVYMYNEGYTHYYEIIHQINHILSVIMTKKGAHDAKCHFLICGSDGYMEDHYRTNRIIPRAVAEEEYRENPHLQMKDNEYPILHTPIFVLTQSQHTNADLYAIGIPDRHYIYCNLYNPFRSFHRGIPFRQKHAKIAYATRHDRGTKYNFTERRDLGDMIPRQYFITDAVPKDNIYWSATEWIDSKEMIEYKYILDTDGRASTWDATAWKLNSGSVILKQKSAWRQWFYDEYLPWIHYVPVENDFSDIQSKFAWCEEHPEECEQMIRNCLALFQRIFRFHNVTEYTENVLRKIDCL